MRKKKNKKLIIIISSVVVALIVALVVGIIVTSDSSAGKANVQSVSKICASGASAGIGNVYAGEVQSQKTVSINANTSYTISQTYVKAGSVVKAGDKLFAYDMTENKMNARQAQLDIDKLNNNSESLKEELYQLMEEREEASNSEKSDYSVKILQKQNEIKQNSFDIESKQLELSNLNDEASNSVVTSPIAGVVRKINDLTSSSASNVYMTIMATGDYRVQGIINEQNMKEIKLGDKVIIHSRVNDSVWYGRISEIDKDSPIETKANSTASSSNYAFYIAIDSTKNLMLGEHVYIEKDLGLSANGKIQLPSYYISDAKTNKAYVFMEQDGKIVKQTVTLGKLNENTNCYEVLSGITLKSYIAYPDSTVKVGMKTVKEAS